MPFTIVLYGLPFLCIFGFPLSFPLDGYFGIKYCCNFFEIMPFLNSLFASCFTFVFALSSPFPLVFSYDVLSLSSFRSFSTYSFASVITIPEPLSAGLIIILESFSNVCNACFSCLVIFDCPFSFMPFRISFLTASI